MGGGPDFPIQYDDCPPATPLSDLALNTLTLDEKKEGVLDGPDVESDIDEATSESVHKEELRRELKALGVKVPVKPDYTKTLDEPSWGDSDEEEDDIEMDSDGEGVLDGEDEDEDVDEERMDGLEEGELVDLRDGK